MPRAVMTSHRCFLVLALIYVFVALGNAFPYEYGVVMPSDPFRFVGESLTLDCNITNENVKENSSMMGFQRNTLNGGQYTIPKEDIRILTSKSIRLFIPRVKLEDDGNYVCYQNTFKNTKRVIGNQKVFVDNRPKRIESIDCSVYNWENMTCRWSLGVHFQHPDNVKVVMKWVTDNAQEPCPELTKTSCGWPSDKYQHTSIYHMVLVVQTVHLGKVVYEAPRQQFKVETEHYIQPAPIRDFQAEEENSTCIRLSWKHSTTRTEDKTFEGKYLKVGSKEWKKINMSLMTMKEKEVNWAAPLEEILYNFMSVPVCDLIPFTNYTFSVAVLPYSRASDAMKSHGRRSDWISVPAMTREDVPGIPPPQCHSCFYIHTCPNPQDGRRCVRIYWGETPVSQRHGKLTDYSIRFEIEGGNSTDPVPKVKVPHGVTNADFTISDAAYKVNLTSSTSKGSSSVPSVINIPSSRQHRPSPPENFLVEMYTHQQSPITYNLSWNRPPSHINADTNITIVWCLAGVEYYTCKNHIQWTTLPSDTDTYNLTQHGRINIGIALEDLIDGRLGTTGVVWTPCIYNRNQRPKAPENVRFSKNPPKGGLIAQWQRSDCATEKAFVTGYKVSICITQDGNSCFGKANHTDDIKRTEHTFLNLNATEHYLVQVWSKSQAGYGLPSLPINATVLPFKLKVPSNSGSALSQALIIVIIIILLIAFLVVMVSCFKCLKDRHNKANKTLSTLNPHAESTNHGSSGRGSGSSSDNSVMANLLGDTNNTENFDGREYHYPVLKHDRDSSSSSGNFSDPGNSSKSISSGSGKMGDNLNGVGLYSKEKNIADGDHYSKMCLANGSGEAGSGNAVVNQPPTRGSVGFHPYKDKISINIPGKSEELRALPAYETPVTSPDSAIDLQPQSPWSFNQQSTLPLRRPNSNYAPPSIAKGDGNVILGRINDNPGDNVPVHQQSQKPNQQPESKNSSISSFKSPTPPSLPEPQSSLPQQPSSSSKLPPTVPPRQPLLDNPPLYNAPLPPNFEISSHSPDIENQSINAQDPGTHLVSFNPNPNPNGYCDKNRNNSPTAYLKRDTDPVNPSENFCTDTFQPNQGIPDNCNNEATPFIFSFEEIANQLNNRPFFVPPPPPFPPTPDPKPHQNTFDDPEAQHIGTTSPSDSQKPVQAPNCMPATFNNNNLIIPFVIDPDSFINNNNEIDDDEKDAIVKSDSKSLCNGDLLHNHHGDPSQTSTSSTNQIEANKAYQTNISSDATDSSGNGNLVPAADRNPSYSQFVAAPPPKNNNYSISSPSSNYL